MTDLLEKAFQRAAKLAPEQQDAIAAWLMQEIEADKAWDDSFSRSLGLLASMAATALDEKNTGTAVPLNPDQL